MRPTKDQVMRFLKPEPATLAELAGLEQLEPGRLRGLPAIGVHEGDIFYCNDATYGGIHNADQMAILPIFHNGKLIAWASAACSPDANIVTRIIRI